MNSRWRLCATLAGDSDKDRGDGGAISSLLESCYTEESSNLPTEQWIASFREWTRKQRPGNPRMDDSRESFYGDRGVLVE